jgi:hypothetical protein
MANQVAQTQADKPDLLWVHLDDFSAGLVDKSFLSSGTEAAIVEAPLGSCTPQGTYSCIALPGGGLGALPGLVFKSTYTETPRGATTIFIVGLALNPALVSGREEIILMVEATSGTHHYFLPYSYVPTVALNNIATGQITATPTPGFFGAPYPTWTRVRTTTPTTKPGYPTLAFPAAVATDSHGTNGHLFLYPDPTTRTAFKAKDLIDISTPAHGITGQVIGFSNSIVVLTGVKYTWPAGTGITINENIDFTTPPNSVTYGNQQTVFVAENPWGYGAWGSISTGELLLVKKQGGGVVVNGDIADPSSAIYLPGIQPTGDFVGHADAAGPGLFYCAQDQGAWVWNGGNTSQKVSSTLRDDFYDCTSNVIASNNYGFFACRWGQLVVFSNNYIYDTESGSWWRLYPTAEFATLLPADKRQFFHYAVGQSGYELWAAPIYITVGSTTPGIGWLYRFDSRVPASSWQWRSTPIHLVPQADRVFDVRQVVVRAACKGVTPTAGSFLKVTVGTETVGVSVKSAEPAPYRFNFGEGAQGLKDLVLTLNVTQLPATQTGQLVVYSVDVGYRIRAHTPATP